MTKSLVQDEHVFQDRKVCKSCNLALAIEGWDWCEDCVDAWALTEADLLPEDRHAKLRSAVKHFEEKQACRLTDTKSINALWDSVDLLYKTAKEHLCQSSSSNASPVATSSKSSCVQETKKRPARSVSKKKRNV